MEQFEQLLTCCVCLDRYRNPKLLPCQHSFCMEPCMDGLTDYVRRQVKCPECRAEHRIPYNGVQGFPTNVTLTRFLELHIEITGDLPDPTSGQVMERCNVCSEKSYCNICMHCEKKICDDCKSAHMDILRREINRINNQIRRGIHRLQDILQIVEKNTSNLQNNITSVSEEIDEIFRRLTKAVKDRTDYMRTEMDKYVTGEMKNLSTLKENLELEISNITSNCDLADKYMNEAVEWDDTELMDTKEIFLKTVEFIRNFEAETSDYSRRIRLSLACDPNQLVNNLSTYGDLHFIHPATSTQSSASLQPTMSGIMRSKSDHRLATQFRQQQDLGLNAEDEPLLGGRKFGERPKPSQDKHDSKYGYDYNEDQYDTSSRSTNKNRFRSRFHRGHHEDEDENESGTVKTDKEKQKVTSTEDVAKGPLSGIFRILDSPRAMKKVQDCEKGPREKKEVKPVTPVAPVQVKPVVAPAAVTPSRRPAARQQSEDEIERIKKENKTAAGTSNTTESERPADTRASSILKKTSTVTSPTAEESDSQTTTTTRASAQKLTPPARSSSESSATESSSEAASSPGPASIKPSEVPSIRPRPATSSSTATSPVVVAEEKKPFQSRFLNQRATTPPKKEESESSSEEESSEEESETEEEAPKVKPVTTTTPTRSTPSAVTSPTSTTAPSVTSRTGILRDSGTTENRRSFEESSLPSTPSRSRYEPASTYTSRTADKENEASRYTPRTRAYEQPEEPSYSSRFLNKSKTSAITSQPSDEQDEDSDSKYGTGRSRYMALKERRNRLARSRSSHTFGDDDDMDEPVSPTTASPSAYLASRYGASNELSRSRSTHALKSREPSPVRGEPEENKEALSSWARYLKNKYGTRSSTATTKDSPRDSGYGASSSSSTASPSASSYSSSAATSSSSPSSTTSASRRLSLGLPLRAANEMHSSDDDSKNLQSSLASPIQPQAVADGMEDTNTSRYCTPRTQYLQKRRQIMQIGGRGSETGKFTWPRGICCGPDNVIAVADSSNHRVQVFDANGNFRFEFGTYGNADGEFDCLAGIAINRIGQFIIADRYNHRIQVFDPAGRFLRAFGSQGTADGKFNYPWGITTDSMGFIYVADKENHRIQVFQSDGTFVGKFGSCGSGEGQLEHPHYIAVSNTNRVIVSDSNNHRIQIFDVNGKVLSCFGGEGSQEGEFKFPRGVAVDESGYICVADSGNNRIQIFHPDGSFLRAFGSWGSGEAEFKGLEGVAIMSNGNILVCDRENHRVQIF